MAFMYYFFLALCVPSLSTALSYARLAQSKGAANASDVGIGTLHGAAVPLSPHFQSVEVGTAPKHIAVLISGQATRFIYKDSFRNVPGGLSWLLCGADAGSHKCTVDVYIVLANSSRKAGYGRYDEKPPYGENAFTPEAIQQFYQQQGARRVSVSFLTNSTMENNFTKVERLVKLHRAKTGDDADQWWNATQALPRISRRWGNNGRMFFLRHTVYAAALQEERKLPYSYTHFLYLREDNAFVDPLKSLDVVIRQQHKEHKGGFVALDKFCGWGAKSDKIYFADRRGADVLFGRTLTDHVEQMTDFLSRGLRLHQYALLEDGVAAQKKEWTLKRNDPLQTENFVEHLLNASGTKVATYDFSRTEIRYHKGTPCVFEIYFKCTREPGRVFQQCNCPYCT